MNEWERGFSKGMGGGGHLVQKTMPRGVYVFGGRGLQSNNKMQFLMQELKALRKEDRIMLMRGQARKARGSKKPGYT